MWAQHKGRIHLLAIQPATNMSGAPKNSLPTVFLHVQSSQRICFRNHADNFATCNMQEHQSLSSAWRCFVDHYIRLSASNNNSNRVLIPRRQSLTIVLPVGGDNAALRRAGLARQAAAPKPVTPQVQ